MKPISLAGSGRALGLLREGGEIGRGTRDAHNDVLRSLRVGVLACHSTHQRQRRPVKVEDDLRARRTTVATIASHAVIILPPAILGIDPDAAILTHDSTVARDHDDFGSIGSFELGPDRTT
jgi:hypothetical protein